MLPGMDGFALIEDLRAEHLDTPVLILSAKRSVSDRVTGLQKGGDDYMVKPFSFSELLAPIQALLRRSSHTTALKARFDEELAARKDVLFVRVVGPQDHVLFMSIPSGHERFDATALNRIKLSGQVSWYTIPLEGGA